MDQNLFAPTGIVSEIDRSPSEDVINHRGDVANH